MSAFVISALRFCLQRAGNGSYGTCCPCRICNCVSIAFSHSSMKINANLLGKVKTQWKTRYLRDPRWRVCERVCKKHERNCPGSGFDVPFSGVCQSHGWFCAGIDPPDTRQAKSSRLWPVGFGWNNFITYMGIHLLAVPDACLSITYSVDFAEDGPLSLAIEKCCYLLAVWSIA